MDRICHPNGSSTVYTYEKGGRLRSVLYPDGSGEKYSYDAKGNMTERITMSGERYHYSYDVLDRIVSITNAVGGTQHFEYDALGHVTEAADENGNITRYEYTPNGNLSKVTDALGNETFYQYDAMGHLTQTSCTGTGGEQTQNTAYTWDKEGHVVAVTDPLGDMETYTYDPAGRMTSKTDRDGYETAISYGADGQVEEIRYADGRTVSLTYNAIRQLEEVKDWLGTTKIAMDEAGRVSSVTDPYGKTVGYEWGRMGERTSVLYPDGRKAAYEYNEAMQLTAMKLITNGAQEKTIRYRYDDAGRLTGKQFPGGSSTSYAYGNLGRVSEILHTGADFSEHYIYGYDILGNKTSAAKERTGIQADSGRYEYSYDEMNRLTGVMHDGQQLRSYSYDAFGNRRRKTEYTQNGKLITTYGYNTKNQLTTENSENGIRNYSYDHRGNLLSVTSGEEVLKAYGFDAANQMSSSMGRTDGTIQKAVYQYNGLGHRMGQSIATGDAAPARTIRYTLDLTRQYHNLLQKTTDRRTDGNLLHSSQTYFWDGNVAGMEEEGRDYFYFQDDLGSPMRLTDEAGRSEEAYGFDEFGNDIRTAKDIFQDSMQSFGFTGYQMDGAGGLYFAQARRYDAGAGRFVSEDFLKGHIAVPYTMNHYNYCWNSPMDLVDLNGMWPSLKDIGKGIKNAASSVGEFVSDHKQQIAAAGIAIGTVVAAGAVSCIPVVGTVAAGAVMGAGLNAAVQYGTTGKVDAKEVAISAACGAVTSFIPGAGSAINSALVKNGVGQIRSKILTVASESVMNAFVSATGTVATDVISENETSVKKIGIDALSSFFISAGVSSLASTFSHTIGESLAQTYHYNREGRLYTVVKLWDSSNNILGLDLGRTLYNETVRDEILSFVKMQIANGVSSVNSEILSFIISQEIANKTKNGCGE